MKTLNMIGLKACTILLLLSVSSIFGQTTIKFEESYKVDEDILLNINSQHTNLVVETWNKDRIEIEAFLDTKGLSEEEATESLQNWKINVTSNKDRMEINSGGDLMWNGNIDLSGMDSIGKMTTEMIGPLMENLVGPMLEGISNNPLPAEFYESMGSIEFDHEAYKKNGEEYMKKWEEQLEDQFGNDFEKAMEAWGENFEKDAEKWSNNLEVGMEDWEKEFEKNMEVWAESFGKHMEAWGENFGKEMEEWAQGLEAGETWDPSSSVPINTMEMDRKSRRNIIIRMPKEAKLRLDVRYGEVELSEKTTNLNANLSHSRLEANTLDGKETIVNASYSPVLVNQWEYGRLNISYVEDCQVERAKSLKLTSNSSEVAIGELLETGIISGTFSSLKIGELASDFTILDITLKNSDLWLDLPETALEFNYAGSQSKISYPSSIKAEPVKNYDSELINGYQKAKDANGVVSIKAQFSDVVVK